MHVSSKVGFIGLGIMGQPMALNLARAGTNLVVWNRSAERCEVLKEAGASVATSVSELFALTDVVLVMLVNEKATDAVLSRATAGFGEMVAGHLVVNMGSTAPDYSRQLEAEIRAAGGRYVEAPVSGSRKPAEAGQLVALLGGDAADVEEVRPILKPMCRETVVCGPIGSGLLMKLAVNLFLTTMVASLVEAVHFAQQNNLDLQKFQAAIEAGPLASDVARVKLPKLIDRDFMAQAALTDVFNSCSLISEAARQANIASPVLDLARKLYGETVDMGYGGLDMVGVIHAIEKRTEELSSTSKPEA